MIGSSLGGLSGASDKAVVHVITAGVLLQASADVEMGTSMLAAAAEEEDEEVQHRLEDGNTPTGGGGGGGGGDGRRSSQ